jgi:hypothetical protein
MNSDNLSRGAHDDAVELAHFVFEHSPFQRSFIFSI